MSKPLLKPGQIVVTTALRATDRMRSLSYRMTGAGADVVNDPITLMIQAVKDALTEAQQVNTPQAWSTLDELVGELKHLTHLRFIEARQATGKAL